MTDIIKCLWSGKEYVLLGIHYINKETGEKVNAFTTTYTSIGGPKAQLVSIDEECGGHYTPWNTWFPAKDMAAALEDAKSWAQAEDIPCFK